jgi:uncharacterized protein
MNCPVCSEKMKTIERLGVEVEICPGCKGIWLDAGELDKLLALDDGEDEAQATEATAMPAEAPAEPAPAKDTGHGSVFDPVPDEMPAEYKHQDRSRFRDMAKHAGAGGGYKPVVPNMGRAQGGRGGGKGQSAAMRSVLESIRKGGAG